MLASKKLGIDHWSKRLIKEFGEALKKNGVEYKLVREIDYISGFPSKDLKSWFSKKKFYKLIEEYEPDLVFVDRQSHFGLETIKAGIPLFVYLRGHFCTSDLDYLTKDKIKSIAKSIGVYGVADPPIGQRLSFHK